MKKRMFKAASHLVPLAMLSSAFAMPIPSAMAQTTERSPVTLTSDVKIERIETGPTGKETTKLYAPGAVSVVPGDKVVFTLQVVNTGTEPASGFRATNPMPDAVQFTSVSENWAEVSVDGGTLWGKLATLKVRTKDAAGTTEVERAATEQDVTHVRWIFPDAIAAGATRTISYRGLVK